MRKVNTLISLILLVSFISSVSFAKEASTEDSGDLKSEIKEYINHHLLDSYDFSLYSFTNEQGEHIYRGFPLPVILWDDGLKVFSSSKFHHGETLAEIDGSYYKLYHNKIYKTNSSGDIDYAEDGHPTNIKPLDFSITKNVFTIFMVGLLMFFVFSRMAKNYKKSTLPSGVGRLLEPIVIYVRDEIAIPNIGKKKYKRYMNYLLTVFFFVWIINLLGLTPLGINVTNNIAVTLALALLTYVITTFTANKNYWGHIFGCQGFQV